MSWHRVNQWVEAEILDRLRRRGQEVLRQAHAGAEQIPARKKFDEIWF